MELADFFTFVGPDDIRIRGSRIGIHSVLYEYIYRSRTPEQIAEQYPTLRLDQVYATILYYLLNQEAIDASMASWLAGEEQAIAAQAQDPTFLAFQERLRQARAQRAACSKSDVSTAGPV